MQYLFIELVKETQSVSTNYDHILYIKIQKRYIDISADWKRKRKSCRKYAVLEQAEKMDEMKTFGWFAKLQK